MIHYVITQDRGISSLLVTQDLNDAIDYFQNTAPPGTGFYVLGSPQPLPLPDIKLIQYKA